MIGKQFGPVLCLLLVIVALSFPLDAEAQCVSTPHDRPDGVDSIGVDGGSLDSGTMNAAFSLWAACGGYGASFPEFKDASSGSYSINVTVQYSDTTSPNGHCGLWTQQDSVGEDHLIQIWTSVSISGNTYNCGPTEETLAHELGHVLGFANSSCGSDYMMGPGVVGGDPNRDPKTPQDSECSAAGQKWMTGEEQATCY